MINPLHLPVRSCQYSNFSTLSDALIDKPYPSSSVKRLPQPAYSPSCKFHSTTNRLGPLQPAITFDYVGQNSKQGVKMLHLATRDNTHTITGGNDRIIINSAHKRMTFRILWPGYREEWARSIDVMSPGPITRASLGHIIAQNFLRFMEANRSVPCASPEWSLSSCSGKIRFENLILVSLVNTFEDSWQADVLVDFR